MLTGAGPPLRRGHRGRARAQVLQGVQLAVPRDVRRAQHGGVLGAVEPFPPEGFPVGVGGLEREALGAQHGAAADELRPEQRRR